MANEQTELPVPGRPRASEALEAALHAAQDWENKVNTLTEQLADAKAQRKLVTEGQLVELVQEEGVRLTGVTLADGSEWEFEQKVRCGINTDDKVAAFQWLEDRNVGHMLKRHLILSFGKDSAKMVTQVRSLLARLLPGYQIGVKIGEDPEGLKDAVVKLLEAGGLLPTVTVTEELELPGATLSSFVKKCLVAGVSLPAEFNVYAPLVGKKVKEAPPVEEATS
jgi:hypothetical protein